MKIRESISIHVSRGVYEVAWPIIGGCIILLEVFLHKVLSPLVKELYNKKINVIVLIGFLVSVVLIGYISYYAVEKINVFRNTVVDNHKESLINTRQLLKEQKAGEDSIMNSFKEQLRKHDELYLPEIKSLQESKIFYLVEPKQKRYDAGVDKLTEQKNIEIQRLDKKYNDLIEQATIRNKEIQKARDKQNKSDETDFKYASFVWLFFSVFCSVAIALYDAQIEEKGKNTHPEKDKESQKEADSSPVTPEVKEQPKPKPKAKKQYRKLSEEEWGNMDVDIGSGMTQIEIAEKYGVSSKTVARRASSIKFKNIKLKKTG